MVHGPQPVCRFLKHPTGTFGAMAAPGATEDEAGVDRRASYLELFSDLVYVACLIQVGALLSHDLTVHGTVDFVVGFSLLWTSWLLLAIHANRFENDDSLHRVLVFVNMVAIAWLFKRIPVFDEFRRELTLGLVVVLATVVAMFGRHARDVGPAGHAARRAVTGIVIGTALLVASLAAPTTRWAGLLWLAGLIAAVGGAAPGVSRTTSAAMHHEPHLLERFALFLLIVMGETFIKVVGSTGSPLWSGPGLRTVGGMAAVFALWWVYFDNLAEVPPLPGRRHRAAWLGLQFVITAAMTAIGVAVGQYGAATSADDLDHRYGVLFGVSLTASLVAIMLLARITALPPDARRHLMLAAGLAATAVAVATALVLATDLPILVLTVSGLLVLVPSAATGRATTTVRQAPSTDPP